MNLCFCVSGKSQEIEIEHCSSNLCDKKDVTYDSPMGQLELLINSSMSCTQEITLKCLLAAAKVRKNFKTPVSKHL